MRTFITITTVLLLAACGGDKDKKAEGDKAAPDDKTAPAADPAAPAADPAADPAPAAAPGSVDQTDPAAVVAVVFEAAKTGDTSKLAGLCHPDVDADGDVKDLCAMTKDHEKWSEFEEYFKDGAVAGEPTVEGETASVAIKFGPGGSESETMQLARKDGSWYLAGL